MATLSAYAAKQMREAIGDAYYQCIILPSYLRRGLDLTEKHSGTIILTLHSNPQWIHESAFVASNATIIGEVHIGCRSTVLFGAVVRGDSSPIWIGDETNVQDLACLHGDPGFPCRLGNRVTIGHGAIVHGAIVEDDVLIGIRAVVLNGARIGRHSIIGAGAVVPEGKAIPPRSLVLGLPGKIAREITDEDILMIEHAAKHYVEAGIQYRAKRS